ncbi:MAG: hypothetical protein ACI4EX_09385 [Lachnospiraceae bacterium]
MRTIRKYFEAVFWLPLARRAYAGLPDGVKKQPLIHQISEYVLDKRFFTDVLYRTECLLYPCFVVNILYAIMQMLLGLYCHSVWCAAVSVYHTMLAVMRIQLLKSTKSDTEENTFILELRKYRLCGFILLCMTPLFASIMILVVHKNSGANYPGFTIVIMAVYAICLVCFAISNLFKLRKYRCPAMSAAKVVCLTAAMMSVLSFVTALASRINGTKSDVFRRGLIGTTSGTVCIVVLGMAVFMVVHASKQFKTYLNKSDIPVDISNSFNKTQI